MCSVCSAYGERPYIRSDFPRGIISAIDFEDTTRIFQDYYEDARQEESFYKRKREGKEI